MWSSQQEAMKGKWLLHLLWLRDCCCCLHTPKCYRVAGWVPPFINTCVGTACSVGGQSSTLGGTQALHTPARRLRPTHPADQKEQRTELLPPVHYAINLTAIRAAVRACTPWDILFHRISPDSRVCKCMRESFVSLCQLATRNSHSPRSGANWIWIWTAISKPNTTRPARAASKLKAHTP